MLRQSSAIVSLLYSIHSAAEVTTAITTTLIKFSFNYNSFLFLPNGDVSLFSVYPLATPVLLITFKLFQKFAYLVFLSNKM